MENLQKINNKGKRIREKEKSEFAKIICSDYN